MADTLAFSWDDLDPAFAGDKKPNSPDDKECGDHFIPKWKDCHDGKAHRPDPGENPYWSGDNSSENRKERDEPWENTKPKSAPEAPEEDDYDPEEEDYYQQQEEERDIQDAAVEAVPEKQWAKIEKNLLEGMAGLGAMYSTIDDVELHKGDAVNRQMELIGTMPELRSGDRFNTFKAASVLEEHVAYTEEWLKQNSDKLPRPEFHQANIEKARFALEALDAVIQTDDPRDIMAWNKLRNDPENLELEDLLQLVDLRRVDLEEGPQNEAEEEYVDNQLAKLERALEGWRESPLNNGAYLAELFYQKPHELYPGERGTRIEMSPFKTNPKVALAILDRSARAGDHAANKALWENFGASQEWHPSSFLFDHNKALAKATREMKTMADWSEIDQADKDLMQAGMDRAEIEDDFEAARAAYEEAMEPHHERYLSGQIKLPTLEKWSRRLEKETGFAALGEKIGNASRSFREAGRRLHKASLKVRDQLKESLRQVNAYNSPDTEVTGAILTNISRAQWAEIDEHDEEYEGHSNRANMSGKKLLNLRMGLRDRPSGYTNAQEIQSSMQDIFSMCHKNLFDDPALMAVSWTSEVFQRAYANSDQNTICLGVSPTSGPGSRKKDAFSRADVAVHEYFHHIENRNPDVANRMQDFYEERTANSPVMARKWEDNKDDPRLQGYELHETFKEDKFFDFYCGKMYGGRGNVNKPEGWVPPSELVSMGIQAFFNDDMWKSMMTEDREHMALMVAMLRGY